MNASSKSLASPLPKFTDEQILRERGPKSPVDLDRPYAFLVEQEQAANGKVEDVATLFLTNRECPFRCLMCDLWKNTIDDPTPLGAIPRQIDFALERLPRASHIKLYNSGNFFDQRAIPVADHQAIADRVAPFRTVIVENHPNLCGDECARFAERIDGRLEVALGLETVHPEALARLNKRMTLEDFRRAARLLRGSNIDVRAFILLRPPGLDEPQGVFWAIESLRFAFDHGAQCCAVIPTRGGNGVLERLADQQLYSAPTLDSLEEVLAEGIGMNRGRVFVDLWDIEKLFACPRCGPARKDRLHQMNLRQQVMPRVPCDCSSTKAGP